MNTEKLCWLLVVLIAGAGIFLRVERSAKFVGPGPDEVFYKSYVENLSRDGLGSYPDLVGQYIAHQSKPETQLILPPLRLTYILAGVAVKTVAGVDSLVATHAVSCAASIILLFVAGAFAWRLGGPSLGLGVFALMAFAPMQIYMAQRALIDGFFALGALACLWLLWENLQRGFAPRWLVAYGASLAFLVATKENAFFVFVAILALLGTAPCLGFGKANRALWLTTFLAPGAAVLVMLLAAGGLNELITVYRLNTQKSLVLPYALKTGDGPWFRYLVDLLLMDPLVVLLAIGALFRLGKNNRAGLYLALFVATSYAIMCQVRYGMNLRYGNMWDMPLRWLACWHLAVLVRPLPARARWLVQGGVIAALCVAGWGAYDLFFVEAGIYDPVPGELLRALLILK